MGKVKQQGDVIDVILQQHNLIRSLFQEVASASGNERASKFKQLAQLLEVHEDAEEQVVHPMTKRIASEVADARIEEENQAKKVLAQLKSMGPDADGFGELFEKLHQAVDAHATHEEKEEFPRLRDRCDESDLRDMADKFQQVQALKGGQMRR
ncbi:hemerythrin domain-containing protein [Bailinhaonella thermotolerans]|nr:hemerythrin domain-containing protein [Bailinhaonella thermotolerans]